MGVKKKKNELIRVLYLDNEVEPLFFEVMSPEAVISYYTAHRLAEH